MAKSIDASEVGRQLNALRKNRRGGGDTRHEKIEHLASIPIGSRETVSEPYRKYACNCIHCRIARGHKKPHPAYVPPDPSEKMTADARSIFAAIRRERKAKP